MVRTAAATLPPARVTAAEEPSDPALGPYPPGAVVRPTPVPGSDPPALSARFDIVLRP